ncbi:hypothetical protein SO802_028955 [Lithocarpus litseifolius]|uniref:Uncharacterized protein n=1 Tax=Lithocarpus litseifolius TaxID=425828 RepID=A0AAW2BS64_9ROSI
MATRFSKRKLSEAQEKKAKTGIKEGLLSKKRHKDDGSLKGDPVVVPPMAAAPVKQHTPRHPTSPTLSLELITPTDKVIKTRVKDRMAYGTFWDDADTSVLKAPDSISVKDLKPLAMKTSQELMSSHVNKIMQVLGESLYFSRKYLDYEEKLASVQSKDKQIEEALAKLQKVGPEAVESFKKSYEYSDKLCDYYVEGLGFFAHIWLSTIQS